jgi:dTDP-4-dehydrorhamnose reductase
MVGALKQTILIVGSGGRLGAALLREWRKRGAAVIGLDRTQLDLSDDRVIRERLGALDFEALANCAAITNVDRCEREPDEAFRINSAAVATIAEICAQKKARCVHISTDYVFDGMKRTPYVEEDEPRPISKYGESKWSGEKCVLAVSAENLVVRVSWVFGPDRPSFLDQILERALKEERVEAIADKVSVPTYTLDAAEMIWRVLERPEIAGILHVCNAGECTWQEYGQHALDCAAAMGMRLKARTVEAIKLVEMKAFVAQRPEYTVLSPAKYASLTGAAVRWWREAVEDYVRTVCVARLQQ